LHRSDSEIDFKHRPQKLAKWTHRKQCLFSAAAVSTKRPQFEDDDDEDIAADEEASFDANGSDADDDRRPGHTVVNLGSIKDKSQVLNGTFLEATTLYPGGIRSDDSQACSLKD
jgi:hypothetical protein